MTSQNEPPREFESKLLPIMREGVEIIKMILFTELRDSIGQRHSSAPSAYAGRLAGAVINELFGTPNLQPEFVAFAAENKESIEVELQNLADRCEKLRIPLTDALRVQFLCDSLEGIDSTAILNSARDRGLLLVDRETPLPKSFLNLVRRLGAAYGLLAGESAGREG
jgi:hypothetical protein